MAKSHCFLAPAKINHFLHITGKRQDGYHTLQTLMQFVDWCDEISITPRTDDKLNLQVQGHLPCLAQDNLVLKAAKALQQITHSQQGADIELKKILPQGAGLGGGSSNAATTLLALNALWNTQLPLKQLHQIGLQLGADVPFFIGGHAALAEGIGEQLTPMPCHENWLLIATPNAHVCTKSMFQNKDLTTDTPSCKICNQDAMTATQANHRSQRFKNDFLSLVCQHYPEVKQAYNWLSGYAHAKLSGSGGCIFACFLSQDEAQCVAEKAPNDIHIVVAKGLNQSPLFANSALKRA